MSINRGRKERIRQQALRAAARQSSPSIAAIKRQRQAARQAAHGEVKSTKGAVVMLQGALDSAIAGAQDSGLKGKYLQQVVSELAQQKGDAAAIVPFTRAGVRSDLRDTLSGLNEDAIGVREDEAATARDNFQSKLSDIRAAKQSAAADHLDAKKDHTVTVKNATITTHNLLEDDQAAAAQNLPVPADDATVTEKNAYAAQEQAKTFLSDLYAGKPSALRHMAAAVATKAEGVDQSEALAIVRRMFEQRRQEVISGLQHGGAPGF